MWELRFLAHQDSIPLLIIHFTQPLVTQPDGELRLRIIHPTELQTNGRLPNPIFRAIAHEIPMVFLAGSSRVHCRRKPGLTGYRTSRHHRAA